MSLSFFIKGIVVGWTTTTILQKGIDKSVAIWYNNIVRMKKEVFVMEMFGGIALGILFVVAWFLFCGIMASMS